MLSLIRLGSWDQSIRCHTKIQFKSDSFPDIPKGNTIHELLQSHTVRETPITMNRLAVSRLARAQQRRFKSAIAVERVWHKSGQSTGVVVYNVPWVHPLPQKPHLKHIFIDLHIWSLESNFQHQKFCDPPLKLIRFLYSTPLLKLMVTP